MVGQAEQVVTGDAVVLDVQIAQLPVRALATLIDVAVIFIGYMAGVMLWAATLTQFDPALSGAVLVIFTILTIVGYPLVFESATRGRTLGKMALGLRVVSDDGGPERFRQALFRALSSVVEIWMFFGGPAVFCSLLSPKGKRIGDVFAGTVVISERGPKLPPPPVMPPSLAWWASSLQLSGLGVRAGRVGPPVPLSGIAIGSPDSRSDGVPHRRRRGIADFSAPAARRSPAVRARRGARRTAPTGARTVAAGARDAATPAVGWTSPVGAPTTRPVCVSAAGHTACVIRRRRFRAPELAATGRRRRAPRLPDRRRIGRRSTPTTARCTPAIPVRHRQVLAT